MANQCEGCLYQEFDNRPYAEADKRYYCLRCKATYKGPSNYTHKRRYNHEEETESV